MKGTVGAEASVRQNCIKKPLILWSIQERLKENQLATDCTRQILLAGTCIYLQAPKKIQLAYGANYRTVPIIERAGCYERIRLNSKVCGTSCGRTQFLLSLRVASVLPTVSELCLAIFQISRYLASLYCLPGLLFCPLCLARDAPLE